MSSKSGIGLGSAYSSRSRIHAVNVSAHVSAVRTLAFVVTAGGQAVICTFRVRLSETNRTRVRQEISRWPRALIARIIDNHIVGHFKGTPTIFEGDGRVARFGANSPSN